jgi:hypothetical protein
MCDHINILQFLSFLFHILFFQNLEYPHSDKFFQKKIQAQAMTNAIQVITYAIQTPPVSTCA